MNKICFGCGAHLQFEDKSKIGYVPEEKYETSDYCQRCFRMKHYGDFEKSEKPKSIKSIINTVNKNAKFVVFLVDFINIYDDVIEIFKSIKKPKVLVVSKSDIIPESISFSQIKSYLRVVYKIKEDILFTNNKSNLNTLSKVLYGKEEVYFLGLTNAGKSTLINHLMEKEKSNNKKLTTSYKENTTLDFVRIKVGNLTIIDSPGFVLNHYELDKNTNIDNEIKPITYQNKTTCTYVVKDAFKIKIEGTTNAIFYFSKNVKLERLYNKEIIGTTFKVKGNRDIVISGLGFIKLTGDAKITISEEVMKYINIRPSITGGNYE